MAGNKSNAKKGSNKVDELIVLLEAQEPAVLHACDCVLKTIDRDFPAHLAARVKQTSKVRGSLKSDVQVSFVGTKTTLAIAVISESPSIPTDRTKDYPKR
jgi:hypothetical protein